MSKKKSNKQKKIFSKNYLEKNKEIIMVINKQAKEKNIEN